MESELWLTYLWVIRLELATQRTRGCVREFLAHVKEVRAGCNWLFAGISDASVRRFYYLTSTHLDSTLPTLTNKAVINPPHTNFYLPSIFPHPSGPRVGCTLQIKSLLLKRAVN